jgi:hypothetical protein
MPVTIIPVQELGAKPKKYGKNQKRLGGIALTNFWTRVYV